MTPEDVWRRKSDAEVQAGLARLTEYTAAGQQVMVSEAAVRGLQAGVVTEGAGDDGEPIGRPGDPSFPVSPARFRQFRQGARPLAESFWL